MATVVEEPKLLPKIDAMLPGATGPVSVAALMMPPNRMAGEGLVMTFACSVTVPSIAASLPLTVAPAPSVMDWFARILPLNADAAPRVAEDPTCQ